MLCDGVVVAASFSPSPTPVKNSPLSRQLPTPTHFPRGIWRSCHAPDVSQMSPSTASLTRLAAWILGPLLFWKNHPNPPQNIFSVGPVNSIGRMLDRFKNWLKSRSWRATSPSRRTCWMWCNRHASGWPRWLFGGSKSPSGCGQNNNEPSPISP